MSGHEASRCTWPELAEPFATGLRHAVDFVLHEFEPVGIVATGTIVRGTPDASSDLDLCVIHRAPFRRRVQQFFNGVPTEIFVKPPGTVRAYFAEEHRDGRRVTAHMLATGVVVLRADPVVDALRAEAAQWLAKDAPISEEERTARRYNIASRLEDALDVLEADDATATMLLSDAVLAMLEYVCMAARGWIPRRKDLLAQVAEDHPVTGELAARFFRATTPAERAEVARQIADATIGARGFFPWDSGAGPAPG